MQCIRVHQFGGPEVLRLEEVPDPTPGPGEVLVRLHAAGVNPVEVYVRSGAYARLPALPYVPGADGGGEVVAVGAGTAGFTPGDRVYVAGAPTYAQLVAAPAEAVWPLPAGLDFAQGAAVGVPYATAYHGLFAVAAAQPGDWLLVHGASGGVGIAAVQLAVAAGLQVVGTAGTDAGRRLVLAQGARAAVDHADLAAAVAATGGHGFDVILEMLANVNLGADLPHLAPGGRVAVVGSRGTVEVNPRDLMNRSSSVHGVMLSNLTPAQRRRVHLALGAGLANGSLRPAVGRRFPLAAAAAAHAAVMSPGAAGKVVLTID